MDMLRFSVHVNISSRLKMKVLIKFWSTKSFVLNDRAENQWKQIAKPTNSTTVGYRVRTAHCSYSIILIVEWCQVSRVVRVSDWWLWHLQISTCTDQHNIIPLIPRILRFSIVICRYSWNGSSNSSGQDQQACGHSPGIIQRRWYSWRHQESHRSSQDQVPGC